MYTKHVFLYNSYIILHIIMYDIWPYIGYNLDISLYIHAMLRAKLRV